jgi:hypothetical protein
MQRMPSNHWTLLSSLVFVAPLCGTLPLVFFSLMTGCTKHGAFQVPIWILFLSSFTATSASGPKAPVCAHDSVKSKNFTVCWTGSPQENAAQRPWLLKLINSECVWFCLIPSELAKSVAGWWNQLHLEDRLCIRRGSPGVFWRRGPTK